MGVLSKGASDRRFGAISTIFSFFFIVATGELRAADVAPGAPTAGDQDPLPTVVYWGTRDRGEDDTAMSRAIGAQIADLAVRYTVLWTRMSDASRGEQIRGAEKISAERRAFSVVWVEFGQVDRIFAFLSGAKGTRLLARVIDPDLEGESGRYEAAGVIVRSTIEGMALCLVTEGLVTEGLVTDSRQPVREAKQEQPMPDARSRSAGVYPFAHLAYGLAGFASANKLANQIDLFLGLGIGEFFGVLVGYQFVPSVRASRGDVGVHLHRHGVKIGAELGGRVGPVELGGRLFAVLFLVDWRSSAPGREFQTVGHDVDVGYGAELHFFVALNVNQWFQINTGPGVLGLIRNSDYLIETSEGEDVVLKPWNWQPFWFISLRFRLP